MIAKSQQKQENTVMSERVNHTTESHIAMSQVAMKSLDTLRKADFSESQSRAQVRAMLFMFDAGIKHVDQSFDKLKAEMAELKAEMDLRFKAVEKNAEIRYEALRSDSRRSNTIIIVGFIGLVLTVVFTV